MAEPVRAPLRRVVSNYSNKFEGLIHAVKNELVERFDRVDDRVESLDQVANAGQNTISDQLALHATALRRIESELARLHELADHLGSVSETALNEVTDARDEVRATRKELVEKISAVAPTARLQDLTGARLADIDGPASGFLNHASSWNGPLSDAGLFINHPYLVEWGEGSAKVRLVNERIIEQPFVFAALADLPLGSRVVDIGGGESTIALALASLGHHVTVVEPRGYPFQHPNLSVFEGPIEEFKPEQPFDAVVLLSTIEHLGIGHYADGTKVNLDADIEAMQVVAGITAPGGRLVLTTPYGPAEVTDLERIYDQDGLMRLVEGWEIAYVAVGCEKDEVTWEVEATELAEPVDANQVAMLVAMRPNSRLKSRSKSAPKTAPTT